MHRWQTTIMAAALTLIPASVIAAGTGFERLAIYLERNLQDHDIEVGFDVVTGDSGLSKLKVLAPDGRTVIDFKTPGSKLGMRHLALESPEPTNDRLLRAEFPAGTYRFEAAAAGGSSLRGT